MSRAWKEAEKEVADFFGGVRRIRVSYSESVADIIHPKYSIEVKYGKQVPGYLNVGYPTLLHVDSGSVYSLTTPSTFDSDRTPMHRYVKTAKFLEDAMEQAASYDSTKIPIVCIKPPRHRGFVICRTVVR